MFGTRFLKFPRAFETLIVLIVVFHIMIFVNILLKKFWPDLTRDPMLLGLTRPDPTRDPMFVGPTRPVTRKFPTRLAPSIQ